jgi:hypothetical protein
MSKDNGVYGRRWLCKPNEADSYISWSVRPMRGGIDADLKIADCNRAVSLAFYGSDKVALRSMRKKLCNIIEELNAFEQAIDNALGDAK